MKYQIEIQKLPKSIVCPNSRYAAIITIEGREYMEKTSNCRTKDEALHEAYLIIKDSYIVGGVDYKNTLIQNPKLKKNLNKFCKMLKMRVFGEW